MSADLRELQNLVDDAMKEDAAIITPDQRTRAIKSAVDRFNKDLPREVVNDIVGDSGYDYDLPTEETKPWVDEFSYVVSVEYPSGEQNPVILDPADYTIYDNGTAKVLRFLSMKPTSAYTIRLKHTTKWILTATSTTIEDRDAWPLACLAASIGLRILASYWLQTTEPNLEVDVIDYNNKSVEATLVADNLENVYRDHVGIPRIGQTKNVEAGVRAAGGTKDLDIDYSWGGDMLTHPKAER